MYQKFARTGAIGFATLGLGLGVAAASTASIDTTGPDSDNHIDVTATNSAEIDNYNTVGVCAKQAPVMSLFTPVQVQSCGNFQHASTGDAKVRDNTTGGDATSGDANNDNSTDTSVSLSNGSVDWSSFFGGGGDWDATIENTGPDSDNTVHLTTTNTLDVDNHNDVNVSNYSTQDAYTGDAKVEHNTTGGNATSGAAENSNSTSTTVSISN